MPAYQALDNVKKGEDLRSDASELQGVNLFISDALGKAGLKRRLYRAREKK